MMKRISIVIMVGAIFLLTACGQIETNMSAREIPEFDFTDQDGNSVTNKDLEGKWWIADLIFTNCTTVCIPMSTNMAKLQKELNDKYIDDLHFVSFTVDPENDTPEVLKNYSKSYDADLANWSFLTGYEFETIQSIALETFMSSVQMFPDTDQVEHGVRFYLVNPEGEVIKHYSGVEIDDLEQIKKDLKKVL